MNTQRLILSILALLFLGFLSSCNLSRSIQKDENGNKVDLRIPPDFGKSEHVLLVRLSDRKNLQKYLKKRISRWYHGNYETTKTVSNSKYQDKDKYRYLFAYNVRFEVGTNYNMPGDMNSHYSTFFEFYVIDRITKERFGPPIIHNVFKSSAKSYLVRLERARLKRQ